MNNERGKFEAWYSSLPNPSPLTRGGEADSYTWASPHTAWLAWQAARKTLEQEPVAHRLVTGDPKRKWMVLQGPPSVGVIRQAQDHGWEVECFYSHPFKPVTPSWADPPAQTVDLGQFRALADRWASDRSYAGSPVDDLRALIDSQT